MLKSLDHVNMLRLHEAFRDGQRTLVPGGQNGAWTGLACFGNMKRWIAYEIPKEDGEILENECFFLRLAVVERILLINFGTSLNMR